MGLPEAHQCCTYPRASATLGRSNGPVRLLIETAGILPSGFGGDSEVIHCENLQGGACGGFPLQSGEPVYLLTPVTGLGPAVCCQQATGPLSVLKYEHSAC